MIVSVCVVSVPVTAFFHSTDWSCLYSIVWSLLNVVESGIKFWLHFFSSFMTYIPVMPNLSQYEIQ